MQEQIDLVKSYAVKVWRFRFLALGVAFVTAIAGWAVVFALPDVYRSSAEMYVDPRSAMDTLLQGIAVDADTVDDEFFRVARESLLSRANLLEIARETDMDVGATSEKELETLVQNLRKSLEITSSGGRNRGSLQQVIIAYEHQDPQQAHAVAKAAMDVFVNTIIGASRTESERGTVFLDAQIAEYEQRLEEAERRLKEFKRENIGLMPSDGTSYFGQLQRIREQVAETRLQLNEAERRRDELKAQLDSYVTGAPRQNRHSERIAALSERLDELRLRYTDNHPDVVSTREQLNQLLSEQQSSGASGAGTPSLGADIATAEFRVELSRAEAEVASLRARLREFERRHDTLEGAVNTMPEVEAQLQQLTRNYDVYRSRYEQLVERREAARISQDAALTGDSAKIRVVEPPRVPIFPEKPNRPLLHAGVFILALGAGAGLALLLTLVQPNFSTTKEVQDAFDVPMLGAIGKVSADGGPAPAFAGMGVVLLSVGGLMALFVGVVYIEIAGIAWPLS